MCVCVCVYLCVYHSTPLEDRNTFRNWLSPTMWVLEIKLRSIGLGGKCLFPMSYLTGQLNKPPS